MLRNIISSLAVAVLALVFVTRQAPAVTTTWDAGGGGDNNFSTAANWSPDGVPLLNGTSDLVFATGTTSGAARVNIAVDVNKITFNKAAASFQLLHQTSTSGSLTIGAGGITAAALSGTGRAYFIKENVTAMGTQTWVTNSSCTLTLDNDLANTGLTALTVTLSGGDLSVLTLQTPAETLGNAITFSPGTVITGTHGLNIIGRVFFNNTTTNSYTGNTKIGTNGNVTVGSADVLPYGVGKGNIIMDNDTSVPATPTAGVLNLNGSNLNINGLSGAAGTGPARVFNSVATGSATQTLTVGNGDATATFNGTILDRLSGSRKLALTKVGGGTQTLAGASTYTGGTTITAGKIVAANSQALGTGGLTFGATSTGTLDIALDAGSDLPASNSFVMNSGGNITLMSGLATPGAGTNHTLDASGGLGIGTITIAQGSNVTSGTARLTLNSPQITAGTAGTLTINPTTANVTLASVLNAGSTSIDRVLNLGGTSSDNIITGGITQSNSPAIFSVTKTNSSTWTLSGTSSYNGTTTISGGILQVNVNQALGTTAAGTTVSAGAALKLNGVNYAAAEALTINGTGILGGGALVSSGTSTFAGAVTAATNSTINTGGGNLTFTGGLVKNGTALTLTGGGTVNVNTTAISGSSANSDLIVDGTTANLNVANDYNGPTFIRNAGAINANVVDALPTANGRSAITMDDSGAGSSNLTLAASQSVASLTGASTSTINLGANTLTVGAATGSTTFAGAISGASGALTKDNVSTQTLSGANTYGGATTINNGTLQVDGDSSGAGGLVTVNTNGKLGGNGKTGSGGVFLVGGTLAPGASIGTLSTGGTLTFDANSAFEWEYNGGSPTPTGATADVMNVGHNLAILSSVTLTGFNLSTTAGMAVATGTKFVAISYAGSWNNGTFTNAPLDDGYVFVDGKRFKIDYNDTAFGDAVNFDEALHGKAVTLTAVPEASSILVMGLGGVFAVGAMWLGKRMGAAIVN